MRSFPCESFALAVGAVVVAPAAKTGCCFAKTSHACRKLTLCIRITQSMTVPPASQPKQCQRLVFGETMQEGVSSPSGSGGPGPCPGR